MRGFAALFVAIYHSTRFHQTEAGYYLIPVTLQDMPFATILWPAYLYGEEAVRLFWVISGFVFAHVYLHRPTSARHFAVARFARLYPLHFVTLLVVAGLQAVSLSTQGHWQITENNDLHHFVLQLFLVDTSLALSDGVSFNAPIWSVSAEILVYVGFFFALPVIRSRPLIGSLMFASFSYVGLLIRPDGFLIGSWVFVCGVFFFAGTACYAAFCARRGNVGSLILALLSGSALAFSIGAIDLLLLWGFCGVVLILAAAERFVVGPNHFARFWGDISYALYLVHMPLQIAAVLVVDLALGGGRDFAMSHWTLPMFLGASVAVAWVTHRAFEKPAGAWIRRRLS